MKKSSTLITNDAVKPVKKDLIQNLVYNILPSQCRLDTLEGREHIVVPMVMLTEGVHHGSDGPFLYSNEELGKTPAAWDHKPVVLYHPERNGQGVSACQPDIINNRKVGIILNTKFVKGRLTAEAWIEKSRANAVDERVMTAIDKGEMMELSTGVFVDMEAAEGQWNGEPYSGIARNFRPDHLALLPDKIGACSIKDGAGFMRNAAKSKDPKSALTHAFDSFMQRLGLVANEMSHSNLDQTICQALKVKYNITAGAMEGPWVWVADVYSNFVVYEYDGKLFRLGYSATDTGVALSDAAPAEVKRVTEYRTVEGAFVGNQNQPVNIDPMKKKEEIVDAIIKNGPGWSEADRVGLMAFNEAQLTLVQNGSTKKEEPATPATATTNTPAKVEVPATPAVVAPVVNKEEPKPVTLDSYIASAPPEVQEVLRNSMKVHNEEKERLVGVITANKNNVFSKEDLGNRPLGELRALAQLAGGTTATSSANYSGMAPVGNTESFKEEALDLPVMNFGKTEKVAK